MLYKVLLTSVILKPYKVSFLFQRMKTAGIESKNSAVCKATHTQLLSFIRADSSWPPALVSTEGPPSCRSVASSTSHLTAVCCYESVPQSWLVHTQWRLHWGLTRTDGQVIQRRWRGPAARRQRRLPAAGCPRGRAAGESAPGPEPPSLDKCCKLDELEPTGESKRKTRHLLHHSIF